MPGASSTTVDVWIVFVWPVIVFIVCSALTAGVGWGWRRSSAWRAKVAARFRGWRLQRRGARAYERAVKLSRTDPQKLLRLVAKRKDGLTLGNIDRFLELVDEENPEFAVELKQVLFNGLFRTSGSAS